MYKKGRDTQSNLTKHCDGDLHQLACPKRKEAIKLGAKLPMTLKEVDADKKKEILAG
jgi:hypothetical protein